VRFIIVLSGDPLTNIYLSLTKIHGKQTDRTSAILTNVLGRNSEWREFMIRRFRTVVLCFIFAALQISSSMAQGKAAPAPLAPVPRQILGAKNVFIANAGGDEMATNEPRFSGTPDRAYNEFYAAVKSWGRFKIVPVPAEADLLLEVRQSVSEGAGRGTGGSSPTPLFRLKIRDAKTNALLWGFSVHGEFGLGQGESDKNFEQAIYRLVIDLRALVTPPGADGNAP
jgi:hypothetical protein